MEMYGMHDSVRANPNPRAGLIEERAVKLGPLAVAAALTAILAPGAVVARDHDPVQPVTDVPAIDGSNHNLSDPHANQAGTAQKRFLPDTYLDHLGGDPSQ